MHIVMEKIARKPSQDPLQEKLRQNKALWNKDVSAFVNDLIHFKKMMNGWPSKFFKERSRISDPVPADPSTIIGSLAGDFQEIVNRGNALIQEQMNYSKNRRKAQPKQLNLPLTQQPQNKTEKTPETSQPDLSKQLSLGLSANYNEYYLISEASNPLSRFFARLLAPAIGSSEKARVRKYRMSLLNSALNIFHNMNKMQASVVGSGPQSIFLASKLMDKVEDNWTFLASGFQTFAEALPNGVVDAGGEIVIPNTDKVVTSPTPILNQQLLSDPDVIKAMSLIQDFKSNADNFSGIIPKKLRQMIMKFDMGEPSTKKELAAEIISDYMSLVANLAFKHKTPNATSLADILFQSIQNPTSNEKKATSQLEIVAQDLLKRWVGKTKHQINPFDKTSAMRLDVYKKTQETKVSLDKIMNSLEKDMEIATLQPLMQQVSNNITQIRNLMRGLTSTIRGMGYQPEFMNLLEKGQLGDYGVNLDPKQKERLDRMLKLKQMRDITNMYSRR